MEHHERSQKAESSNSADVSLDLHFQRLRSMSDSDLDSNSSGDQKLTHLSNSYASNKKSSGILSKIRELAHTGAQQPASSVASSPFWSKNKKAPGVIKHVAAAEKVTRVIGASYPPPKTDSDTQVVVNGKKSSSPGSPKPLMARGSAGDTDMVRKVDSDLQRSATPPSPYEAHSQSKLRKFQKLLDKPNVDLEALRKLGWQGVPDSVRAMTWKLLMGYLPTNQDRREATIERKQKEYCECIPKYYDIDDIQRSAEERTLFRQIQIDVPRTNPHLPLFQSTIVQQCLARVLYIWAIRHPASGYVQGINDLATPFFVVFLSDVLGVGGEEVLNCDITKVDEATLRSIEADTYWCMTKLLDGIQDNYTFSQPGIQRMIHKLSELVHRMDAPLHDHFKQQDVIFIQFAFRWMNCLLMRELPLHLVIRIWDTYLSELESLSTFHIYVCAAFLAKFSEELRTLEFQDIMLFLKTPPTTGWGNKEIELLLSQAYMWKTLFDDAPKHLANEEE